MTEDDIVIWFLRVLMEEIPEVPSNAVVKLEQRIRTHWGGARPYVSKGSGFVRTGELPRRTDGQFASTSTYYRWMHRRPPRR
jgi:hypothetical protein